MNLSYNELLQKAKSECDSFSLVWRAEFKFNENAKSVENSLKPYLLKEQLVKEWPGTQLLKADALLRTYLVNAASMEILKMTGDIYKWLSPDYPEDLAFYKKGKVWFASIAHEKDSWFAEV